MKNLFYFVILLLTVISTYAGNLTVFNVVPAIQGAEKETAEDIVRIQKDRIADTSIVIFTLVPEGNPPIDKFSVLGERFKKIQKHVDGRANLGILLQSTLGHGWILKNKNNLGHFVLIDSLKENPNKCCPLHSGVIEYMKDICRKAAMLKPSHIMIDDDFRIYTPPSGCLCPLHLEKISEKLGRKISAKEAKAHMMGTTDEDKRITKIIDDVIIDSVCDLAKKMREAIDEVDDKLPASVCVCTADLRFAERLGKIFAAKGQEPIIRINNARYAKANISPRNFATTMYKSIQQLAHLKGKGIIIAETDTLPHNRYGTSARSLHANYCGYIFDGCQGAKQWITSTSEYEKGGNEAYRKILSEHADFYDTLAKEVKDIVKVSGFATLIPEKIYYNMNPFSSKVYSSIKTWAQSLCCVTGLPVNFEFVGKNPGFLTASELKQFSDDEIMKQLARGLTVDSTAAVELCKRGYGKYLGVDATMYVENIINGEIITDDEINGDIKFKSMVASASNKAKLVPNSPKTRVLANYVSKRFSQDDKENFKTITPSCTYFENELGGKVVVVASSIGDNNYNSYMRYPRKAFFLNVFNRIESFKYWYPYDAEMYVKTGTQKDGSELVGLFNFGWDPLDEVELMFAEKPSKVMMLKKDGKWESVKYSIEGKLLKVHQKLEPMYPMVLKMK